jgi:hypothetical protein
MDTLTAPQRSDRRDIDVADSLQWPSLSERAPRTSLPDRVALRVALALLLWGTRPRLAPSSATGRRAEEDRERRERDWRHRYHRLPLS